METNRKPVIGLAGAIGSGKSTVARAFETLGCRVIDSDAQAHAALNEPEVIRQVRELLGDEVIDRGGRPIRKAIGRKVFGQPELLERLNAIIHPRVHEMRAEQIARADAMVAAIVLDTPLLFEAGVDAECDATVFVEASLETRRTRVKENRGWSADELDRRQQHQMHPAAKRARCDYVIVNESSEADLVPQAKEILGNVLMKHQG